MEIAINDELILFTKHTTMIVWIHYYAFHGRVTLFFANNSLTECRIAIKFLHNIFLTHEVIFSKHTMFINTSTKEFTLLNNATPNHDITFEHSLF